MNICTILLEFSAPYMYVAIVLLYTVFYFVGHTDVIMGALATNNPAISEKLKFLQYGESHQMIYLSSTRLCIVNVISQEHGPKFLP
jgi:hypothetical protein